jgi:hypothetical protein
MIKYLKNESAVISLEACIVLPIFIFVMMFMYGFMVMFTGQNTVAHALVQTAESLSLDSYAAERLDENVVNDAVSAVETAEEMINGWITKAENSENNASAVFASTERWYEKDEVTINGVVKERFKAFLAGGSKDKYNNILKHVGIVGEIEFISKIDEESGVLEIKIKFNQKFLYDFRGLGVFDREMTVTQDMWGL